LFETAFIQTLIQQGYAIIFFIVLCEQLDLSIPGGLFLLVAGAIAGDGQLDFRLILLLATLACLLGDGIWHFVGRRMGSSILPLICKLSFNPDSCVGRTKTYFFRYGAKILLIAKFIPGVNAITPPLSGVARIGVGRFFLMDFFGALLWASVFTGLGFWFGHRLEKAAEYLQWVGKLFWLLVFIILIAYICWKFIRWKQFVKEMRLARISPEELKRKIDNDENPFILDVRHAMEFEAMPHVIPGALYQPIEELQANPPDIPEGREVVLYCD
jgi:membrane protein DedA with SNARE-associated domain